MLNEADWGVAAQVFNREHLIHQDERNGLGNVQVQVPGTNRQAVISNKASRSVEDSRLGGTQYIHTAAVTASDPKMQCLPCWQGCINTRKLVRIGFSF